MHARLLRLVPAVGLALATVTTVHLPTAADAAPRVSVTNSAGKAVADPTYATTLSLSGNGFQSIRGGHGGIYVFFGTVSGSWRPSQGGKVGTNYRYVPDSESQDNQGFQKFVAFPGSDTASAANGGTIAASGSWRTSITVPGATFKSVDRQGKVVSVDCRKVTCGIITIGAHGVVNARNESFTPVSFASLQQSQRQQPSATGTAAPDAAKPSATPDTPRTVTGPPKADVDRTTAVLGRVLSFRGSSFTPGEQVSATLDDGRAAVGPLSAGQSGEVAGVLRLPRDLGVGTHELRLTSAATGREATVSFAVRDETTPAAAEDTIPWLAIAFVALGAVALVGSIIFAALRLRRPRQEPADVA